MERTISKEELLEIMPFDYADDVLYFPIRHHSPVCSYHVEQIIKDYAPDCILIEGPDNSNDILSYIAHEETTYPIAIYYSYKDVKGELGEENENYSCYYPILEYSPELVAIKSALAKDIFVKFIDLPYAKRLLNTKNEYGVRKKADKNSYNDDYLLSDHKFFEAVCEETNTRSFDEFWEKSFEINGLSMSTKDFVTQFNMYTYILRANSKQEDLQNEGTLIREQYMYEQILNAKKTYKKILVITGGFHTYGLIQLQNDKKSQIEFKSVIKPQEKTYIMPYSMEETDALNGYASGMISPNFYQDIWLNINNVDTTYTDTILKYLLAVSKECKKKKILITLSDQISAFTSANMLAQLRNKNQCGKYELLDGVTSCFIKGELNLSTNTPIETLKKLLTGNSVGNICSQSPTPPIVSDFQEICKKYKLKISDTLQKEVVLGIFASERHREISKFLYQLHFLDCAFSTKTRGSTLKDKTDRNLIKETWTYKWSAKVMARLIENSIYGATVYSASYQLLTKKIKEASTSKDCALLLIDCFLMGINDKLGFLKDKIEDIIINDGDFFSSASALEYLVQLYDLKELYNESDTLEYKNLIDICFNKTVSVLSYVQNISEDLESQVIKLIKLLFDITCKAQFENKKPVLIDIFKEIIQDKSTNPAVLGAITGILYSTNEIDSNDIFEMFNSYLSDVQNTIKSARYLSGLFYTARDLIFVSEEFIKILHKMISDISYEDFQQIIPELRLAFSYFTVSETNKIAKKVANFYNVSKEEITKKSISEEDIEYGKKLNAYLLSKLDLGEV